jgi:hypothetical protein
VCGGDSGVFVLAHSAFASGREAVGRVGCVRLHRCLPLPPLPPPPPLPPLPILPPLQTLQTLPVPALPTLPTLPSLPFFPRIPQGGSSRAEPPPTPPCRSAAAPALLTRPHVRVSAVCRYVANWLWRAQKVSDYTISWPPFFAAIVQMMPFAYFFITIPKIKR